MVEARVFMKQHNRHSNGSAIGLPLAQWERLLREALGDAAHVALLKAWVQPLEALEEAVSITDAEHNRILYVNPAWQELYGYTAAEALGKTPAKILNLDEVSQRILQKVAVASRKRGWEGELLNHDKSGNLLTIHLRTAPLRAPDGRLVCMMGIARRATPTNGSANGNGNGNKPAWMAAMGKLTPRELETFSWFGTGQTTKQVGQKLGVSIFTVQTHRTRIKAKLGVRSNTAMCRLAFEWVAGGH